MIVYNDEYRVLVTLIPEMNDGNVRWTCDAMPRRFFSATCRDGQRETSYTQRGHGSPSEDAMELLRRGAIWQTEVSKSATSRGTLVESATTMIVRRESLSTVTVMGHSLFSNRN